MMDCIRIWDKKEGKFVAKYEMKDVHSIHHGKYSEYYSKDDIAGNGVRPNDSVLIIKFNDSSVASFGSQFAMILF